MSNSSWARTPSAPLDHLAASSRDRSAWHSVLSDHAWLLSRARRNVGAALGLRHEPEDLVQDVVLQALKHRGDWSRSGRLRAWLACAMRTRAAELARKAAYRTAEGLNDVVGESNHDPLARAGRNELERNLHGLVARLDARARRVVLLRVVEDLPFATIAARLEIREEHARAIFSRAAMKMRGRLATGVA